MTKPREKKREELQAEIEDGKKKIRQLENREKVLRQKLSQEERRTRSHRLIVRGAVFESIVPEARPMTGKGKPHCHIMLPMRPLGERGAWAVSPIFVFAALPIPCRPFRKRRGGMAQAMPPRTVLRPASPAGTALTSR